MTFSDILGLLFYIPIQILKIPIVLGGVSFTLWEFMLFGLVSYLLMRFILGFLGGSSNE